MAWRNGITIMFGTLMCIVSLDGAIESEQSNCTVCDGRDADGNPIAAGSEHMLTRVRRPQRCPSCNNEDPATFKTAREVSKGEYAVLDKTKLAEAKGDAVGNTNRVISITAHPVDEVRSSTLPGDSTYYLTPAKGTEQMYGMVVDLIRRHPEYAFMGLYTPVSRTALFEITVFGDSLILSERARTESIKVAQPVAPFAAEAAHQQMVDMLLPLLVKPFDRATYIDSYAEQLAAMLAATETVAGLASGRNRSTAAAKAPTLDLMAQLNAALAAAQANV